MTRKREIIDWILSAPLDWMLNDFVNLEDADLILGGDPGFMASFRKSHTGPRWEKIQGSWTCRVRDLVPHFSGSAPELEEMLRALVAIIELPDPGSPFPLIKAIPTPTRTLADSTVQTQVPPKMSVRTTRGRKPDPPEIIAKILPKTPHRVISRTPHTVHPPHAPAATVPAVVVPRDVAPPTLLDTKETAKLLGIEVKTLCGWRVDGVGPPYTKIGHLVRYQISDLQAWVDSRKVRPK